MPEPVPYGERVVWKPARPRFHPLRLLVSWLVSAAALLVAAWIVPGVSVNGFGGAVVAALLIAILNALIPPIIAALRIPFMALLGFVIVLLVDAALLKLASEIRPEAIEVDDFGWALARRARGLGGDGRDRRHGGHERRRHVHAPRRQRIAKRQGGATRTDIPGIIFLEIDGLALPVLRRAMRDGNAPTLASWLADGSHRLVEWEPDLSSQTGASQAGILLGSNQDIPAFRWVDKETGPRDRLLGAAECAEIEKAHTTGHGLLANGGAEPREPLLGRGRGGHPDLEPDERREAREPGLPRLLRQRLQRHADARPLLLGDRPGVDGGAAGELAAT